jgi:hypothetical protein
LCNDFRYRDGRDRRSREKRKMGVDGKFRVCAGENGARLLWRRMMRHHALDLLVF